MSSTFWAVLLLTALLVLYCGKSPPLASEYLEALETRVMWERLDEKITQLVLAIALRVLILLAVDVSFLSLFS